MLTIIQNFITFITFYFQNFSFFSENLCRINKDSDFLNLDLKNQSNLEKFANINILKPANDIWSIMVLDNTILKLVILILILPLIFCLLLILFFFKNQYYLHLKGGRNKIEF